MLKRLGHVGDLGVNGRITGLTAKERDIIMCSKSDSE
jgi:hypothetical protein